MGDPTAVMGRRLVAGIIDYFLLPFGVAVAALVLFGGFEEVDFCSNLDSNCFTVESGGSTDYYQVEGLAWFYAGAFVVWLLDLVLLQAATGASVGKLALGLRTVDETGQTAGIGKILVRQLLWIVDGIGCVVPLVGPITGLATKGHRRVGDLAAKTNVVATASVGTPPMPGVAPGGYAVPATPPGPGGGFAATPPAPGEAWGTTTPPPPGGAGVAPPRTGTAPQASGMPNEPQWDPARNTYIQWDPAGQRWMAYDQDAAEWRPIS